MIKRVLFFSLISIMICSITFSAMAEDFEFSFRNGIQFGDSINEVFTKEEENGLTLKKVGDDRLFISEISLSTIEECKLAYDFEDDKLTSISIDYNIMGENVIKRQDEYKIINDGLIRKYGSPSYSDINEMNGIKGGAVYTYKNDTSRDKRLINQNQWILDDKNNNKIIIEHIIYSFTFGKDTTIYEHTLTYQVIELDKPTQEEVDRDL